MYKDKNRKLIIASLISLLVVPFSLSLGQGRWNIVKEGTVGFNDLFTEEPRSSTPVAYIDTNDVAHQYYTIEGALKAAKDDAGSNTVYVIPSEAEGKCNTVSIIHDCEIAVGDTLVLPYSSETAITDGRIVTSAFADQDASSVSKNRRLNVSLNSKLTNNGCLIIGGELGGSLPVTGQTAGLYAQMTLGPNGQITNGSGSSSIECYGYIKESSKNNGSKITLNSGELLEPMVFYDFKGGNNTKTWKNAGVFPFNLYDFPNITTSISISGSAQINALTYLYINSAKMNVIFGSIPILGANGLFKIGLNGSVNFKHDGFWSGTESCTSSNESQLLSQITCISFKGDCLLTSLTIDFSSSNLSSAQVSTAKVLLGFSKITTSDFLFPIPFNINMTIAENGNLDCLYGIKFLPGSTFTVLKNGSVNFQNQCVFYSSSSNEFWPSNPSSIRTKPAKLITYGIAIFRSNVGGYVYSESTSALLGVKGETSVQKTELDDSGNKIKYSEPENLKSNILKPDASYLTDTAVEKGFYKAVTNSVDLSDEKYYWNVTTDPCIVTITIVGSDDPGTDYGSSKSFTLNATIEPEQPAERTATYKWLVDGAEQAESSSTLSNILINASPEKDMEHSANVTVTTTNQKGDPVILKDSQQLIARRKKPTIVSFGSDKNGGKGNQTITFSGILKDFNEENGDLAKLDISDGNTPLVNTSTYSVISTVLEEKDDGTVAFTSIVTFENKTTWYSRSHTFIVDLIVQDEHNSNKEIAKFGKSITIELKY